MNKLILVTSPPACGKTFVTKKLAKAMENCVYLDKDTLIVLSKQIYKVAGQEYNRSSQFFEDEIRDYEYKAVMDLAFEALEYNDTVFINAPFKKEINDTEYMKNLKEKLLAQGTKLVVIWVHTDVDVVHERMIERASDRDAWKLANWELYILSQNYEKPKGIDDLIVFENSNEEAYQKSMQDVVSYLKSI